MPPIRLIEAGGARQPQEEEHAQDDEGQDADDDADDADDAAGAARRMQRCTDHLWALQKEEVHTQGCYSA